MKYLILMLLSSCVKISPPLIVPEKVTFTDLKPIIARRCIGCHNWTYESAYAKRNLIFNKVVIQRTMPMNGYLTDQERYMFAQWVQQGGSQ